MTPPSSLISGMLNQTCEVAPYTGRINGDATYSDAITHMCRIDYVAKRVLNATGTAVVSTATIYIAAEIGTQDKIILADGTTKTPLQVNKLHDLSGDFSHCEVMI